MNIDALRLFAEVAAGASFTAAAARRDVNPSSVSRAIAQLETELGTRLFQRSTRRVALTEAGARLHARTGALLDAFDAALEEMHEPASAPRGTLRVTASVAFGERVLAPLVGPFRERCPDVALELQLSDRRVDLVAEGIDLAVRLGDVTGADLVTTRLMATSYRVVASPAWVCATFGDASHRMDDPAELGAHRCVLIDLVGHRSAWHWRARDSRTSGTVRVDGDVRCSSALAVRRCALDGVGPALLADWLVDDDVAGGALIDLCPNFEIAATDVGSAAWLVYPSREWLPGKTRAMIDFLKARIGT